MSENSPQIFDESVKDVITDIDLRTIPAGSILVVGEDALITPSARDTIHAKSITVEHRNKRQRIGAQRIIAIGADHGGFEMKEKLKSYLSGKGLRTRDFGTLSSDAVDYPDFAHAVARAVADGQCDLGILLDGAGIGSCMAANKVPGIRAAMCYDAATARNSREHNYANVLTLGAKMLSEEQITQVVDAWLATPEGEARHGKRVAKIMAIERQYLK